MKQLFFIFLLLFPLLDCLAQEPPAKIEDEITFEMKDVEVQPDFSGGLDNFYAFFEKNFKKPDVPSLIGKVFVSFIVEANGTLSEIRTLKDVGFGTGAEAERVLQLSPKWLPGKKDGKIVRVSYILPIPIQTQ
jgi:protein TonB